MEKFLKNITDYNLIEKKDKVVLGVSGGADSIYLLEMFNNIKVQYELELIVAHVNHGVRGEAADADEHFVKEKAMEMGLQYEVIKVNMNEYAKKHKMSSEDAGRLLRYDFFHKLAGASGKIAVAHNREDQAETVLMRIIRGTGVDGLSAMRYKKDQVIRPILNVSRREIEKYLERLNIKYVTDLTNLQCDYVRNKIRLKTIPGIEKAYNPNFVDSLFNLSNIAFEESSYLEKLAQKAYEKYAKGNKLNIEKLLMEDVAIVKRVLRIALHNVNNTLRGIGQVHVDGILNLMQGQSGKTIHLPQNIVVSKNFGYLVFAKQKENVKIKTSFLKYGTNHTQLGTFIIEKVMGRGDYNKNIVYIDADVIKGNISLRTRCAGDYFYPIGMKGRKKLKDYFIDEKIPLEERDKIPLIADEENIIWVCQHRLSELYKVSESTSNIISIKYEV